MFADKALSWAGYAMGPRCVTNSFAIHERHATLLGGSHDSAAENWTLFIPGTVKGAVRDVDTEEETVTVNRTW